MWHASLSLSFITRLSCGPRASDWQVYDHNECLHVSWNTGTKQSCKLPFFLPRTSPGDAFLCHISNYGADDTPTPKRCRSVGCRRVKGRAVGSNRRPPSLMAEYKRGLAIRGTRDGFISSHHSNEKEARESRDPVN